MTAPEKPPIFEIIVGTYEEFVLGYQFTIDDEMKAELSHTFATHSHKASVRSVAARGKFVVSGGADETINIYDMIARRECGMLMENNGTVTSVTFTPDCSHLICTSEDGSIKVFRQGSWQLEKVWTSAHKGAAVTWLSVHPSGKMALSVGKDHTLRTWNLVKGRPAYTINMYNRCRQLEYVTWSPGGTMFAIPMDNRLEIDSTETGGAVCVHQFTSKVTACLFLTDEIICAGDASGNVFGCYTDRDKHTWSVILEGRIKGLGYLDGYLVAASSSGKIFVYSVTLLKISEAPELVCSVDTGCRITCLTLFDVKSFKRNSETKRNSKTSSDQKSLKQSTGGKKRKVDSEVKNSSESTQKKNVKCSKIVCCPKNQHWVVEDSKFKT